MTTAKGVDVFLEEYFHTLSDKEKSEFASRGYEVRRFGRDKESSDRLINSILKGRKRAISSPYSEKKKLPNVGSYGIVLDYQDDPRCLIKYTEIEVKPFAEIDLEFAQEEGGASGDIREWADEHRSLFKEGDPGFNDSSLIVCGRFKLVFK